jgi:hypothetical protein
MTTRNILFSSKTFNVEVQDNFGNALVCFTSVPGNSKEDAIGLVKSKLVFVASQLDANMAFKSPMLSIAERNEHLHGTGPRQDQMNSDTLNK